MKKVLLTLGLIITFAIVFQSCTSIESAGENGSRQAGIGTNAGQNEANFGDVEGKDWILLELRTPGETIYMDRAKLGEIGLSGVYTIRFEEGMLGGMGSPNRYAGPYTLGGNMILGIGDILSTMMFSFIQPEGLTEFEYFALLSGVTRWNLEEGRLELFSSGSDGIESVLVFVLVQ